MGRVPKGPKLQGYDPESQHVIKHCANFQTHLGDKPTNCHRDPIKGARAGTLAHLFCASWIYVCSEFAEMNQIMVTQ